MDNMASNVIPFRKKREKIVITTGSDRPAQSPARGAPGQVPAAIKGTSDCEYKNILVDIVIMANQALFNLEFVRIIKKAKVDQDEGSCSGCPQNDITRGCRVKISVADILERLVELPD